MNEINVLDFALGEHEGVTVINDTLGNIDVDVYSFTTPGRYSGIMVPVPTMVMSITECCVGMLLYIVSSVTILPIVSMVGENCGCHLSLHTHYTSEQWK